MNLFNVDSKIFVHQICNILDLLIPKYYSVIFYNREIIKGKSKNLPNN